jgi:xylulokinase
MIGNNFFMYLIGIDIGTTNLKAVLYDYAGNAIVRSSTPTITHYGEAGCAVYQTDEIWDGVCTLLQDMMAQARRQPQFAPDQIKGLAITGMGETIAPFDAQDLPLYEAIAWFDPRTEPQYRWLKEEYGRCALFKMTGLPPAPIYSLNKILWIRDNQPAVFEQARKWLTMQDFVGLRLTGEYATEYSQATRTMCFDIQAKQWSEDILRIIGIGKDAFPPAYPGGTVVGSVHRQASQATGLAEGTPVVTGGHDHVCGALAVGVFQQGPVLDSCGTTEALMLSLDQVHLTEELSRTDLVHGCHVARDKYYMIAGLYTSGIILRWFQEQFAPTALNDEAAYQQLLDETRSVGPGAEGVLFLPHFRGANTTPVDPLSRSSFLGILSHHTRGHLFRAVIEGVCYEVRQHLEAMERYAEVEVSQLRVIGSARNAFWLQTKADILNKPLEVPTLTEGTSLGAALLAGIGVGVYQDERDAFQQVYRPGTVYEPNPDYVRRYDSWYREIFQHIYPTLRPLNHKISALLRDVKAS